MDYSGRSILISFVVPAYNEEKYLAKTLASIFSEIGERTDCEVVVVDNASTDGTRAVAERYPRVRVVEELKQGLPYARQAGYLAARGVLIANIDADTVILKGWLAYALGSFEESPGLVCLSGFCRYDEVIYWEKVVAGFFYLMAYVLYAVVKILTGKGLIAQGGNSVVRRRALDMISGYNTSIRFYGEDTDFALRLNKAGEVRLTWSLKATTSARRFKEEGIARAGFRYLVNFLSVVVFGRPWSKSHENYRG